ncbi:MAG TPA: glycosyltransferase family 4 protein [Thermoleophilaceae bacterium]|nr:glycosyltransferase family 4 protein [Thermoleophilaceae bacterium]
MDAKPDPPISVQVVDPPAWTPPYDHALSAALARAGAEVELVTTEFPLTAVPAGDGYAVGERFYRASSRLSGDSRGGPAVAARRALKLAEHVPDMLAWRRHAKAADVVHLQWLTFPVVDARLLPRDRPLVFTAHDVPPREPRRGDLAALRRLLGTVDAVIVHSRYGARFLTDELKAPAERIHVVPHGVFDYLTRLPSERPLDGELAAVEGPVILFFGLLRSYKGLDVLLDAFRDVEGAELWIVGLPLLPLEELEERARRAKGRVRFIPRFVDDDEVPALFRRADIVALPYRQIDQSGVLHVAMAFGTPLVLSRVGGFTELGEDHGAAVLVEPGDADGLRAALQELVDDPDARARLGAAAAAAAGRELSWDAVAERTLGIYRTVLGR